MYYHGGSTWDPPGTFHPNGCIGYATSSDGINWTRYSGIPILCKGTPGSWEDFSVAGEAVFNLTAMGIGTGYRMYYTGESNNPRKRGMGMATSNDGINWTRYPGNPVIAYNTLTSFGGWLSSIIRCWFAHRTQMMPIMTVWEDQLVYCWMASSTESCTAAAMSGGT